MWKVGRRRLLLRAGALAVASCARAVHGAGGREPDARSVAIPARGTTLTAYLARPRAAARAPIVLVCHDQRGLRPHVEAIARRLAASGYVALAVDLLSREGGTSAQTDERARALLAAAPVARHVGDFADALAYARAQPFARSGRAGIVGFGLGGGVAWRVAASAPDVAAAVSFYGLPVAPADAAKIEAAMLAILAGRDERVNAMLPAVEAAMRAGGGTLKVTVYPDVEQGFLDDTGERYDAAAARAAWTEALAWLRRYLRG